MLKTIAAGRIGKSAETRTAQNGDMFTSFSLAVSYGKDKTAWLDCTLRGERGQKLAPHLTKGMAVTVAGFPQARGYQKQDGTVQASLTLWVDDVTFQSSAKKDGQDDTQREPRPSDDNRGRTMGGNGGGASGWEPPPDLDDEIPFACIACLPGVDGVR